MSRPKVKLGEFNKYYWGVIAPREVQENRERWKQDQAWKDHLDRLLKRSRWAKKYYSPESPSSSTQEHTFNSLVQNSNFKN